MEIQQHDGLVVEATVFSAGLRRASVRGRGVAGEREAPRLEVRLPSLPPPLYRPPGGAALEMGSPKGAAAKAGGVPPKANGGAPHPRVCNPRRRGAQGGRTSPPGAGSPPHFSPWGPPGWVAPPGGPPGPIRWSRYNTGDPESFPMAENTLPIYNSSPPDHSGTPRDVRDLIRDSEQLSGYCILISLQP